MSPTKSKHKTPDSLVVVSHMDDEALFFSGLILSKKWKWHVVCVTDGNADGQGWVRAKEFEDSCKLLKVTKGEVWNYPDVFSQRLDAQALVERLSALGKYKRVFTHGILGEYGHNHHQDVSYAVHKAFGAATPVFSPAYNIYPDFKITLSPAQYRKKTRLLWEIYGSETRRFLNYLPATYVEGFARVSVKEVEAIYEFLTHGSPLDKAAVKRNKWLLPWIEQGGAQLKDRRF